MSLARPRRKRSILSCIVRRIILAIYRWRGWTLDGHLPDIPKFVIAGAPHTSNWDFVFFTGATAAEGIEPAFMGKHTLFKGVMRNFMLDMGGIPIDRTKRANVVEQVADEFARRDRLALVIAAEGTRSSRGEWKSGFYTELRYKSREHSGLAWGAIFGKMILEQLIMDLEDLYGLSGKRYGP